MGHHRQAHVRVSKGKRSKPKKRKRDQDSVPPQPDRPVPPPPAIASSVDIGLSNITRNLQLGAGNLTPKAISQELPSDSGNPAPYSVVFVARSGPPSPFFSHLPQMVAVASKSRHLAEPIRLVGFSRACEERLSACMGVPRVTSVALRAGDMAQSKALVQFVQERVLAVEMPWLDEFGKGNYQEAKIKTIQAPIGKKRQKKGQ